VRSPELFEELRAAPDAAALFAQGRAALREVRALRADLFLQVMPAAYAATRTAWRAVALLLLCGARWRAFVIGNGNWEAAVQAALDAFARGSQAAPLRRAARRLGFDLALLKPLGALLFGYLFASALVAVRVLIVAGALAADLLAILSSPGLWVRRKKRRPSSPFTGGN